MLANPTIDTHTSIEIRIKWKKFSAAITYLAKSLEEAKEIINRAKENENYERHNAYRVTEEWLDI